MPLECAVHGSPLDEERRCRVCLRLAWFDMLRDWEAAAAASLTPARFETPAQFERGLTLARTKVRKLAREIVDAGQVFAQVAVACYWEYEAQVTADEVPPSVIEGWRLGYVEAGQYVMASVMWRALQPRPAGRVYGSENR